MNYEATMQYETARRGGVRGRDGSGVRMGGYVGLCA